MEEGNAEDAPNDDTIDDDFIQEENSDNDEAEHVNNIAQNMVAPSGREWSDIRAVVGRQPVENVIHDIRQGFRRGLHPESRSEGFLVLFDTMVSTAVRYTNRHGTRLARQHNCQWRLTNDEEMLAFIGLHMLSGCFKAYHRDARELWSNRDGQPVFRATMSYERFAQLKSAMRFDDPLRRDRNDKLAPVREIVDIFNTKLAEIYTPGPYLCIDEMLVEFHGRVAFRQYIPTKPGKFGVKIFWLTENLETPEGVKTIPLKCLVYIGEGTVSTGERDEAYSLAEAITMHLCRPFLGQGRNVTCDNYFTSFPLAERLLRHRTTILGTVRSNKRDIPLEAKALVDRNRGDSVHFYSENVTLCSFWDKGRSPVLVLSTSHGHQHNLPDGKPQMVQCYNATKSGVDNLDKQVRCYRSKRKCSRWPYGLFFTLVDTGIVLLLRLFDLDSHYSFKKELGYELVAPLILRRLQMPNLRLTVRQAIVSTGLAPVRPLAHAQARGNQGRCAHCPRARDRKTKRTCNQCGCFVCPEHSLNHCPDCG